MHFTKVFLLPMLINSLMWKSGFVPKTQNSHMGNSVTYETSQLKIKPKNFQTFV